jgi:hypothetical protein
MNSSRLDIYFSSCASGIYLVSSGKCQSMSSAAGERVDEEAGRENNQRKEKSFHAFFGSMSYAFSVEVQRDKTSFITWPSNGKGRKISSVT